VATPQRATGARSDTPQVVIAPRTLVLLVVTALGGVLLIALAWTAHAILVQLLVAVILAMALEPVVQQFERRGLRRGQAVAIAFTAALIGVAAFAYLLIPPLVDQVRSFGHHTPELLQKLTHGHGRLGLLERHFHIVEHARVWIAQRGGAMVLAKPALHTLGSLFGTGAAVVAVAFLTLFIALGGRKWFEGFLGIVPQGSREHWRRAGSGVATAVGGYVAGNLLISLIAGTVTTVILLLTHVPYPVPLGLTVAVFDLIPLVGATLGTIIVAAVALTKGIPTTVIVVASMWVYQKVENHTLLPLVYHRTVKLSPLAIAVSVAAGAEIGGVVGALLGIPIAGAVKVVSHELVAWRRGDTPSSATDLKPSAPGPIKTRRPPARHPA
jgi:predicted PurR-regulated permease PerM